MTFRDADHDGRKRGGGTGKGRKGVIDRAVLGWIGRWWLASHGGVWWGKWSMSRPEGGGGGKRLDGCGWWRLNGNTSGCDNWGGKMGEDGGRWGKMGDQ